MLMFRRRREPSADAASGPVPAPVAPAPVRPAPGAVSWATSRRKRNRQDRRNQFSLLIVRGDGTRVIRFNFPRPAVVGAGVALATVVSLTGALLGDWVQLRELTREAVTFQAQINEQRATINTFNRRLAEIRGEMTGWRDMHAKIWEPFGPGLAPGGRDRGIGGATSGNATPAALSPTDELNRLSDNVKEQTDSLRALEKLMTRASRALSALPSRWPVRGAVNSEYGHRQSPWSSDREFHNGIDIRAERGTSIYAPAAGSVIHAGPAQEYGITVILDHGQDIRTLYGHMSKLNVQPGQKVERGAVIGYTGNTGRSSGPHLHYEIYVKGQSVNPRGYLWD
jgi:murein DD-endopeptidase MepM/ murein hydrolase activator NlpD